MADPEFFYQIIQFLSTSATNPNYIYELDDYLHQWILFESADEKSKPHQTTQIPTDDDFDDATNEGHHHQRHLLSKFYRSIGTEAETEMLMLMTITSLISPHHPSNNESSFRSAHLLLLSFLLGPNLTSTRLDPGPSPASLDDRLDIALRYMEAIDPDDIKLRCLQLIHKILSKPRTQLNTAIVFHLIFGSGTDNGFFLRAIAEGLPNNPLTLGQMDEVVLGLNLLDSQNALANDHGESAIGNNLRSFAVWIVAQSVSCLDSGLAFYLVKHPKINLQIRSYLSHLSQLTNQQRFGSLCSDLFMRACSGDDDVYLSLLGGFSLVLISGLKAPEILTHILSLPPTFSSPLRLISQFSTHHLENIVRTNLPTPTPRMIERARDVTTVLLSIDSIRNLFIANTKEQYSLKPVDSQAKTSGRTSGEESDAPDPRRQQLHVDYYHQHTSKPSFLKALQNCQCPSIDVLNQVLEGDSSRFNGFDLIKFLEGVVDTFFVSPAIVSSQLDFILSQTSFQINLDLNGCISSSLNDMIHPLTRWQQLNPLGERINNNNATPPSSSFGSSTWPVPLIFLILSAHTIPVILSLCECFFTRSEMFPVSLNHVLTLDVDGILFVSKRDSDAAFTGDVVKETRWKNDDDRKSPSHPHRPIPAEISERYRHSKSASLFSSFLSTLNANGSKNDDSLYNGRPIPPLSLTPLHYIIWNSKFHFPPSFTKLSKRPGAEQVLELMIEYYIASLISNTTDQIHKPYRTLFQQIT